MTLNQTQYCAERLKEVLQQAFHALQFQLLLRSDFEREETVKFLDEERVS